MMLWIVSGACRRGDASAGVDADAGELSVRDLELGGVEPGPYVDSNLGQLSDRDQSGAYGASRSTTLMPVSNISDSVD